MLAENDFFSKCVPDAHKSTKYIFLLSLALELPVHYDVDVLCSLDALSINELACLEFVHERVVHQKLEHLKGKLREEGMPQPDILQSEHAFHILLKRQTFISLDQVFDNAVNIIDVILLVFGQVFGSLSVE